MKKKNSNSLLGNMTWKFAERISAQLVTMLVSIVLARILDPSDYGTVSVVTIFITLANVFVSDGFGTALIQKKNADALDFSSVLYFNLALSAVLYIVLFFTAPFISLYFGNEYKQLVPILRVLGLRLILTAVNSIQSAYVSRKLLFRKYFWSTLSGTIASAFVGIWMAYQGFGAWALVAQYLTNTTVNSIVLAISLGRVPLLAFSFRRLKGLVGFGSRVLGTNLLSTVYLELRAFIIGKVYSAESLAFFDKAKQFPSLIITNVNTTISQVLFPKMSKDQDDRSKIKATTKNSIRFSSFLMCPLMLGFAAVAENFVIVVLSEKWLPCVPLIWCLCADYLFYPIHSTNMQAIKAVGRSDLLLKLELIKKGIELIVLFAVMRISVLAIAIAMAACSVSFVVLNAIPTGRLIGYRISEQIFDILPSILSSLVMAFAVFLIGQLSLPAIPELLIQVLCGASVYILLAIITKNHEYRKLLSIIKEKFHR